MSVVIGLVTDVIVAADTEVEGSATTRVERSNRIVRIGPRATVCVIPSLPCITVCSLLLCARNAAAQHNPHIVPDRHPVCKVKSMLIGGAGGQQRRSVLGGVHLPTRARDVQRNVTTAKVTSLPGGINPIGTACFTVTGIKGPIESVTTSEARITGTKFG